MKRMAEPFTKEQWRTFVLTSRAVPPDRPEKFRDYLGLGEAERGELDRARWRYHSRLGIVATPDMRRIHRELRLGMYVNSDPQASPSTGFVIDGQATLGKSTLVKRFGRDWELDLRRQDPDEFEKPCEDYIPVVYVSMPAKATPKVLAQRFANFLGIPHTKSTTEAWLIDNVVKTLDVCGTELVIIDDVHNIKPYLRAGEETNTFLKDLQSHTAAMFVLIGVNVEETGLLSEGQDDFRAQMGGRYTPLRVEPFGKRVLRGDLTTKAAKAQMLEWALVVQAFEDQLDLYAHEQGSLASSDCLYLLERTSGRISTLSYLVRNAAAAAIFDGTERIDRAILECTFGDWSASKESELRTGKRRGT